jgi:hypothetical protein
MEQSAVRPRPCAFRCSSISAKPARHGRGACSVAWTIWWPGMAMTPEEKALMPGMKR